MKITLSILASLGFLFQVACTKKPESNGAGYSGRPINTVITSAKNIQIERVAENKYRFSAPAGTVTRGGGSVAEAVLTVWNVDSQTLTQIGTSQNETEKINGILVDRFSPLSDGSFVRESTIAPEKEFFLIVANDPESGNEVPIPAAKGSSETTAVFAKLESGNPGLAETVFSSTLASAISAPALPWTGSKLLGAAGVATRSWSTAADSSGNVYVGGYTYGGLGGNSVNGPPDAFIAKYNSAGVRQWTRQLGVTALDTYGTSVATDLSGNAYLTGFTYGGLDGNVRTGSIDLFLVKYSPAGVKQWTRQLGASGAATKGLSVAVDPTGSIYITGSTDGALDGNVRLGNMDLILVKYNSAGGKEWTKQLGLAASTTEGQSVSSDASGNIFVAGHTDGNFDGNALTGTSDMLLIKVNSSGQRLASALLGVAGSSTEGTGVATDSFGNIFVTGHTDGGLDGNTLLGVNDSFVTKFDTNLFRAWVRQVGVATANTFGYSVAADASGNVFITGFTDGGLDGNVLNGAENTYLVKFGPTGTKQWLRQFGAPAATTDGFGVCTDSTGNVFVSGSTTGYLDGIVRTGTEDLFLTKFSSSGTKQ